MGLKVISILKRDPIYMRKCGSFQKWWNFRHDMEFLFARSCMLNKFQIENNSRKSSGEYTFFVSFQGYKLKKMQVLKAL